MVSPVEIANGEDVVGVKVGNATAKAGRTPRWTQVLVSDVSGGILERA